MEEFENNAMFWQKIDTLMASSSVITKWKKGEAHPDVAGGYFPLDSGFIANDDNDSLAQFYKGSHGSKVEAIILITDILDKQIRPVLLIGTDEAEQKEILHFISGFDYKKGIIIRRGYRIPDWEINSEY